MTIKVMIDKCPKLAYLCHMDWNEEIDAIGLLCPLPVLRTRKRLGPMAQGTIVRVLTTDPAALIDMPHFCAQSGHEYLGNEDDGEVTVHFLRKA